MKARERQFLIESLDDRGYCWCRRDHRTFNGQDTALEFIMRQRANTVKYLEEASTEEVKGRIRASLSHMDAVIDLLQRKQGESDGSE